MVENLSNFKGSDIEKDEDKERLEKQLETSDNPGSPAI